MMLVDRDIAHVHTAILHHIANRNGGGPLTEEYWRKRLISLLNNGHLSNAQLAAVDGLLLILASQGVNGIKRREDTSASA